MELRSGRRYHRRASKTVKDIIASSKKAQTTTTSSEHGKNKTGSKSKSVVDITYRYDLAKTRHPSHPLGPNVRIRSRSMSPLNTCEPLQRQPRVMRSCGNIPYRRENIRSPIQTYKHKFAPITEEFTFPKNKKTV